MSAVTMYQERFSKNLQHLTDIKRLLNLHKKAFKMDDGNFGFVGDMQRIEELLDEIKRSVASSVGNLNEQLTSSKR